MLILQVALQGPGRTCGCFPQRKVRPRLLKTAQSFRVFGHTRRNARDLSEPPKRNDRGPPQTVDRNYACAFYLIKILYELIYLDPDRLCRGSNTAGDGAWPPYNHLKAPQLDEFVIKSAKLLRADLETEAPWDRNP